MPPLSRRRHAGIQSEAGLHFNNLNYAFSCQAYLRDISNWQRRWTFPSNDKSYVAPRGMSSSSDIPPARRPVTKKPRAKWHAKTTRRGGSTSAPNAPFIFAFFPGMRSRYLQTTPPRLYGTIRVWRGMTGYRLPLLLSCFYLVYIFPRPALSLG